MHMIIILYKSKNGTHVTFSFTSSSLFRRIGILFYNYAMCHCDYKRKSFNERNKIQNI